MNDVCLILPCNLYVIPYFKVYERMFSEMDMMYDIILWNRSLIEEKCRGRIISHNIPDTANNKDPKKVLKYFGFAKFVKQELKNNKYKKIVFLDTSSCTLVLLHGFLRKNYMKKYWVDIRDYSFENIFLYKYMLGKTLKNAFGCDISSRGFLKFLPNIDNYCVTHNIDFDTINQLENHCIEEYPDNENHVIRISFIGNVRYYGINKTLLDIFKNDPRFKIQFYGTGSEVLSEYCEKNGIQNVEFEGRFPFEKTAEFYQKTDIINNLYGNNTMEVKTALSNKLYYSLYLDKPILVYPDTYMCDVVSKYGLGFVVDFKSDNIPDKLYEWYKRQFSESREKRDDLKKNVEADFEDYITKFKLFVLGKREKN